MKRFFSFSSILMFMLIVSVFSNYNFAQVTVTLPTISGAPGEEKYADITVTSLTGLNVTAVEFSVIYDPNVIEIWRRTSTSISGTIINTYPTDNTNPISSTDQYVDESPKTPGTYNIAWASSDPLVGSGTLLKLRIRFKTAGTTTLTFGAPLNFKFNSGTPTATTVDGSATVATENHLPVFDSVPAKSVNENESLTFTVNATDTDGDALTYSVSGNPTGSTFNTTTKTFSWTPDYTQAGSYNVTFKANDGKGDGTLTVPITVVNINRLPSLTVAPAGPFTIDEGGSVNLTCSATDPDAGSIFTYSVSPKPAGATLDASTGVFAWTADFTQAGSYSLVFTVTDEAGGTDSKTVEVTVNNKNGAPAFNPLDGQTFNENEEKGFVVIATDPDNDPLTYSVSNLPSGATFDTDLHIFTWKPTYSQAGKYVVTFSVTDGTNPVSMDIIITVNNVNRAPEITTPMQNQNVTVHNVPVEFSFQYAGSDPDGDALSWTLAAGPTGAAISNTGLFTWTPKADQANSQFQVSVRLSDGTASVTSSATLTTGAIVGIDDEMSGIPTSFQLKQNYPNPFNPTTTITIGLPEDSRVKVAVYNLIGQEMALVIDKRMSAGYHNLEFDASSLKSGVYLYRLEADNFVQVKKMVLIK